MGYPFDNWLVVTHNSNQLVVILAATRFVPDKRRLLVPDTATEPETVTREIAIDAPPEEVWEAVSTDEGRDRWLEPDADRRLVVERSLPPFHISWWWWHESDDEPARHVAVDVRARPDGGTRVTVTESQPATLPIARLAASFALACPA
jgi:hypothetical protein